jgi:hypothetical protein
MLLNLDQYFEKYRNDGESYNAFIKRVLAVKFGRAGRVFYRKEGKFIHVDQETGKQTLLNELKPAEKKSDVDASL